MTHCPNALTGTTISRPKSVSEYSTLGGLVGYTARKTKPSRSKPRNVDASIFWETPPTMRLNSLKRFGPPSRGMMIWIVHLSPALDSASVTGLQEWFQPRYLVPKKCLLVSLARSPT